MPVGRRSPATFPRPVHPTNITGDLIEGACRTELRQRDKTHIGENPSEKTRRETPSRKPVSLNCAIFPEPHLGKAQADQSKMRSVQADGFSSSRPIKNALSSG